MTETVGLIGLGGMGQAMATNLLKAGFGLRVYNRTAEKARPLLEHGAVLAQPGGGGRARRRRGDHGMKSGVDEIRCRSIIFARKDESTPDYAPAAMTWSRARMG